ncbi:hypothetical protein ACH5RR_002816 [Cinchona calisaya]|uniref:Uncharacterized protein n=1 Tax=Cinchona calisaya TaxID=153742 RepID=A0ABD3AT16_9GENT
MRNLVRSGRFRAWVGPRRKATTQHFEERRKYWPKVREEVKKLRTQIGRIAWVDHLRVVAEEVGDATAFWPCPVPR